MTNDWMRKDENGKPIIDMDGHIFKVLSEKEQNESKNTLYLWIHRYNGIWHLKFGVTHKTIWERYNDAGTIHQQMIKCWESELWDKDFEQLLHEKFEWDGEKTENDMYSEESYTVKNYEEVLEFMRTITHHVATHGKEIKKEFEEEHKKNRFKKTFSCREEQERFVEKFLAYYNARNRKERRFLLYAVCRFGKTATSLYALIEKLHLKRILILSSKCDTKDSWFKDYEKWSFCQNYLFFDKEQIQQDSSLLNEENMIAWCSFQSTAKVELYDYNDEENETDYDEEPWQKLVSETDWDIVIIDECHYGVDTKRSSELINKILNSGNTFLLEISATPFKKIQNNEYTVENSFIYTLIDEWNDHHNDSDYVPVQLRILNIIDEMERYKRTLIGQMQRYNDVQSNIDNCFIEGKFSWRAYFSQFTKGALGDEFDMCYKLYYSQTGPNCLVYVNRVHDGDKLAKSLDSDNYNVVNVCGNNKIKKQDIDKLLETSDKPVIIISCGRFMTGVTLEKITNVIFMGRVNSAEMYIQYGLRGKNRFKGRTQPCAIYDLNTEVYIYSDAFKRMISSEAKSKKKSLKDMIKDFEKAMAIFEVSNNMLIEVKDFVVKFTNEFSHIYSDREIPYCSFAMDLKLLKQIEDLFPKNKHKSKNPSLNINDQQIPMARELTGTDEDNSNDETDDSKKKKKLSNDEIKKQRDLQNKFREQIKYIPSFMRYNNVAEVEDLFSDTNERLLKIWHNIKIDIFKRIKELVISDEWIEMCDNIKSVRDSLSDDDMSWMYRGIIPPYLILDSNYITEIAINTLKKYTNINNEIIYINFSKEINFNESGKHYCVCTQKDYEQIFNNLHWNTYYDKIIIFDSTEYNQLFQKGEVMKLKNCVGNPPYEGKGNPLYLRILKDVNNACENVAWLCPSQWTKTPDNDSFMKDIKEYSCSNLIEHKNLGNPFKDASVGNDIAAYHFGKAEKYESYEDLFYERFKNPKMTKSIFEKFKNYQNKILIKDPFAETYNNLNAADRYNIKCDTKEKKYCVNAGWVRGHYDTKNSKPVWDWTTLFSSDKRTQYNFEYIQNGHHWYFDSTEECKNFINYTENDIIGYSILITKITTNNTGIVLKYIPYMPDYKHNWSDEEIKNEIGLTQEQYEFIKTEMKDYGWKTFKNE